jgi:hypothetical protein
MTFSALAATLATMLTAATAIAALPEPATAWSDFPVDKIAEGPGAFDASSLLEKPAGKDGPIVARGGHFYTSRIGGKRIRFFGVNFCFGACFPTREQADRIAPRLARFGINAVRFHHMDMAPFPSGIFSDKKLSTLDPVAMERLDYFIAALKKHGIYSNLNLHVSRHWTKAAGMKNGDKTPEFDKLIDLFYPELIDVQKKYAKELLTHVNPYTKNAYTDEPAICMVEINNENSLFTWGGDRRLAQIPEPYAGYLQSMWNDWLVRKYGSREKLATAWSVGQQPLGENLLKDSKLDTVAADKSPWIQEKHGDGAMTVERRDDAAHIDVTRITGTTWHLQFKQTGIALKKGQFYTLKFTATGEADRILEAVTIQEKPPHRLVGLSDYVVLSDKERSYALHFTAKEDCDNARLSFMLGNKRGTVILKDLTLAPGGQTGLVGDEDPTQSTVKRFDPASAVTASRQRDWYDFLQTVDQSYFLNMYRYLREDLRLKTPITGTIGLDVLSTLSQSKMDFVDAHGYWDHPTFPNKPWDHADWRITNTPMVDAPEGNTLFDMAAIRVWGKPFSVTEFNHGSPNDWEAEGVPLLAAFAALQDWDAVYLFSWSHNAKLDKDHIDSYFDIAGNPGKLAAMPTAARIFLGGGVKPLPEVPPVMLSREDGIAGARQYMARMWRQMAEQRGVKTDMLLKGQLSLSFQDIGWDAKVPPDNRPIAWTASGPGTGKFTFSDPAAAVFVGFPRGEKITLGPVTLADSNTPFIAATLVSADGKTAMDKAPRLLLTLMARQSNTDMKWNEQRTTVADKWGKGPTRIEAVTGNITLAGGWKIYPLTPEGKAAEPLPATNNVVDLSGTKTLWYELRK